MKAKTLFGMCAALAVCAGLATTASAGPTPGSKGIKAEMMTKGIKIDPVRIRGVRMVAGKIYPTTPWIAYNPKGGVADSTEYAFDAYESDTGQPGGAPGQGGGRYTLSWNADGTQVENPHWVNDMTLAAGNNGAKAKFADIGFKNEENEATYSYILFTAEDYVGDPGLECGDPAFENPFDGVEYQYVQVPKNVGTYYYSNLDLTDGDLFHQLPADGSGAYMAFMCKGLDGGGNPIPSKTQPALWGTGEDEIPPDGRNGTQDLAFVADDSTPPTCASDNSNNIPNYATEASCECYDYTFGVAPNPDPLCAMVGFSGDDASGCYADCDGSGELDIDDFICFQTDFGFNDPAADCDGSGELDVDDFICFQTAYGVGCG